MDVREQPTKSRPDIEEVLGVGAGRRTSRRRLWQSLIVIGVLVVSGAVAYGLLQGRSKNTVRYVTETAEVGPLTVIVTATGSVQPINEVDVSSELSGTVRRVLVDYNTTVKAGEVLAELDTDKLQATVESSRAKLMAARAKVKDAEATLDEKRLEYDRKQRLVEREFSSAQDLEIAKAAFERASAAVDSAKADVSAAAADLKLNETNLGKACICSPINGIVLSRNVEPGQTVASNLQAPVLFTLAEDLAKMEVQVDVDEADVGQVSEGQTAVFNVDAYPDKRFSAYIRELRYGSETVQGVVTYKAVLETDNTDLLLRPGMTATAEITVQELKDVITIPNAALRFSPSTNEVIDDRSFIRKLLPGRPQLRKPSRPPTSGPDRKIWVFVDGEAKEVAVTIGATDGHRTHIVTGDIAPGQAVIVDTVANGT